MDKLKMHSPNLTESNIAKLAELFPSCVTEARDDDGNLKQAIDFDHLRQELSDHIVEGPQERYHLNWPGKREALLAANAPIAKTLRPCLEESINFEKTKNLFIEGDNLDALKLLQETYLGKVKMVYIDPPYNTGKDFVYNDDFSESALSYLSKSNQNEERANNSKLVSNPESNGRFHSDWQSMIYSRIRLAKNLLSDEGVLLISIDDGEVSNLRKICDEVFGEDKFAAQIIWKKRNTPPNDRTIGAQHDYILLYVKKDFRGFSLKPRSSDQINRYKNPDDHPKGPWVAGDLTGNVKGGRFVKSLHYPIVNPDSGVEFYPPNNGNWRFNKERMNSLLEEDAIYFGKKGDSFPKLKRFLCDVKEGVTWSSLWDYLPLNTSGSNEMKEIFGNSVIFENPKPLGLIENVINLGAAGKDSIVLDFFAGSSTTAHAVLKKNASDGGNRKFIMVQLPEFIDEEREAYKLGYRNIADLSKDRIRKAGENLLASQYDEKWDLDVGFRILKIDSSNMQEVYYQPGELRQDMLTKVTDNIRDDRTPEDLLFQVLLDWGVDLSLPIEQKEIAGRTVFFVDGSDKYMALVACFDLDIDEEIVKQLAEYEPLRAVFRDAGFANDSVKINVEQIFTQKSPNTDVKVI